MEVFYPKEEARSLVSLLLEEKYGIEKYQHILKPEYTLDSQQIEYLNSAIVRLQAAEPIQYILEKATFHGREFNVNNNVLIPRPETEQLCTLALEKIATIISKEFLNSTDKSAREDSKIVRVLDLCTGSGCIAWTLALEAESTEVEARGIEVWAVDISKEALELASNQPFDQSKRPKFMQADVLDSPKATSSQICHLEDYFDIIVSNPPYVRESEKQHMRANVLDYEPGLALFVADTNPLVFYKAVLEWAKAKLNPKGWVLLEINEEFGKETADLYSNAGFQNISVIKDFFEKDRFVVAQKCL